MTWIDTPVPPSPLPSLFFSFWGVFRTRKKWIYREKKSSTRVTAEGHYRSFSGSSLEGSPYPSESKTDLRRKTKEARARRTLLHFFIFFYPPADGEKQSFSSPHFRVFSYASCVDLTQLLSQPNASWRTLRLPFTRYRLRLKLRKITRRCLPYRHHGSSTTGCEPHQSLYVWYFCACLCSAALVEAFCCVSSFCFPHCCRLRVYHTNTIMMAVWGVLF